MNGYRIAADVVLVLHTAFIAFVLFGLIVVFIGMAKRWEWVRNFWFRVAHLAAIAYVVVQALFGLVCPLTTLENNLRVRGGERAYSEGGFIQHWLHQLIFFDAEPWVFTLCYTAFGLLVAATMWWAPPRWPWRARGGASGDSTSSPGASSDLEVQRRVGSDIPRSTSG
ncbi:MAG TPA: DUF2784 domain-containing protein [Tepidisphaeraceae bacterium]|nr:DUF2784 domain-containing protein [Tepidisphaeraceae bacterium]